MVHERVDEDLSHVDWAAHTMSDARFVRCRFVEADLSELSTVGVVFDDCDFSGARFNASTHHRTAFLRCVFRRTSFFAAVLAGCKLTGSVFLDAQLRPLTVEGGDWSYVQLRGADLRGLNLSGVRLCEADLSEADLRKAVLCEADLTYARLRQARLDDTDLRGAILHAVDLQQVNLRRTRIDVAQAVQYAQAHGAVVTDLRK